MTRLADGSAMINGTASGIEPVFAVAYIREGARIAIGDIDVARVTGAAAELGDDLPVKKKEVGEEMPDGRMGRAEELTGIAVFLASDDADYIVAQTDNVDGGNWKN